LIGLKLLTKPVYIFRGKERIMNIEMGDLSWPEVEDVLKETNALIFPVGSTEQHGPHLPVNVDTVTTRYIAIEVARKVINEFNVRVLVAPTIPYGEVGESRKFPGTVGLEVETMTKVVEELVYGFVSHGFKNILVLNGHNENTEPIAIALRKVHHHFPDAGLFAANTWRLGFDVWPKISKGGRAGSGHACEKETAMSLFIQPGNVHLEKAVKGSKTGAIPQKYLVVPSPGAPRVFFHSRASGKKVSGITADPSFATPENGQKFVKAIIDDVAEIVMAIIKSEGNVMEKTPEHYA
jgi:creatinine amidohydrolase